MDKYGTLTLRKLTTVLFIVSIACVTTSSRSIADQVIADDLIVQNSECVGFDCANGESFGFDTIRLKENNTRIKFDDTSLGSFPKNDWQLTANDSANGGAEKFSIDDVTGGRTPFTIIGGAPSNSLYIASTGRVGLRTSTPVLDLHIATSNTPALRLEQNSSGGFTAQTWDIAGNEASFFIRDVTSGSRLPFRIRPGAPSSSIDISASGDVGIGTASPNAKLHVLLGGTNFNFHESTAMGIQNNANATDAVVFSLIAGTGTNSNSQIAFGDTDNEFQGRIVYDHSTLDRFRFFTNGVVRMTLNNNTATNLLDMSNGAVLTQGGAWQNASSRDFKENINPLSYEAARDTVMHLSPVTFKYKQEGGEDYVGFIAEDVPDLVATADRKHLSAMDVTAVLAKVVQEQQRTIEKLQQQVAELQNRR
ncbi:MAG: tail fiber domain-containing protein [Candidatus Binatia bacterium]